ncbi:hypothetical protein [Candidatus Odyssella thessalonicensis]|uniref:hypothetical protein n=1 Tax=Candidatus Odyssella thessalonicensis TaxID=84647 RepID=UPI000225C15A|nr:hypothetical protein [Candidatus Odyssella thessalonicensis]
MRKTTRYKHFMPMLLVSVASLTASNGIGAESLTEETPKGVTNLTTQLVTVAPSNPTAAAPSQEGIKSAVISYVSGVALKYGTVSGIGSLLGNIYGPHVANVLFQKFAAPCIPFPSVFNPLYVMAQKQALVYGMTYGSAVGALALPVMVTASQVVAYGVAKTTKVAVNYGQHLYGNYKWKQDVLTDKSDSAYKFEELENELDGFTKLSPETVAAAA